MNQTNPKSIHFVQAYRTKFGPNRSRSLGGTDRLTGVIKITGLADFHIFFETYLETAHHYDVTIYVTVNINKPVIIQNYEKQW
jgi:hypothetical protein